MHTNPTRRRMLALTGAAMSLGFPARADGPALLRRPAPVQVIEGRAFGSTWRITLPDQAPAAPRRAVAGLLDGIDRQMSPWRDDSEITAFNRSAREVRVSPETALVAQVALDVAAASDGWFDPSVGPLVARWGFGPITGDGTPRWQGLSVAGDSLSKDAAGLTMDLCGIAKGRALDLLAARLLDAGHADFLADLGGELAARGQHPSGRDWQIAVEDPRPEVAGSAFGLRLPDGMAIATSGLRAQSYAVGPQRYGHIIDPHHAAPVGGAIASVSVLAESAMLADAWATALTAAGADGAALARRQGLAALFISHDGVGLRHETTSGFKRHLI